MNANSLVDRSHLVVGRAVVTGGAGFIGSHLSRALSMQDWNVLALDNGRAADLSRLDGVDCLHFDIARATPGQWQEVLEGADTVFHLAAEKYNSSKSTPQQVIDTNITGTRGLLDGVEHCGVRKVVFTSSLYAYGSMGPATMAETDVPAPNTVYGASKLCGEGLLRDASRRTQLETVSLRLFFVYGPGQFAEGGYKSVIVRNFERMAGGQAPVILGDGLQSLDYVYIDDVVQALIAASQPGISDLVCNIGSGVGRSVQELTETMIEVAGWPEPADHGPPDWTAGSRRVGDPGLALTRLGWRAATPLQQGLDAVWRSMCPS